MKTWRKDLTRKAAWLGACAFGLWLAIGPTPASLFADGAIKVRLGTLIPQGSSSYKHLQAMGEAWKNAPGGGVSLTLYPDGRMGDESEMVRRMRVGQLQAGTLTLVGLSDVEPAVTGLQNMPMVFRDLKEVDYVGEKLHAKLEQKMEEKGFVTLFWGDAGWLRFFSKQPFETPEEFKKVKVFCWAGSPEQVDIMKSAGYSPVPLAATDILPNLQTGLIDATPMVPFFALAAQIDGAAPHMLELNWAPLVGATILSKKTWDLIPEATRAVMRKSAAEAGEKIKADNRREAVEAVDAMKKRGLIVHPVSPALEAQWRTAVEAFYPQIRGRLVPADIFDEVMNILKEYRATEGQAQK